MKKQILYMLCATALLSSCHIYKSYDRPEDITASGLYRDPAADNDTLASDTTNFGNLPWREVFTDPQLQSLIEQGLKQNTDLLSAALNVKAAEASLMSARLAYAPSIGLSPQGTISSFDKNAATKTYSLPVTASWQVDLFGLHDQIQAVYATMQLGWRGMLYVDVSVRNDWASMLAFTPKQNIFYPSVGLSAVISSMADLSKAGISFLKVRGSYAEVGNAPERYITGPNYTLTNGVVSTATIAPAKHLEAERTKSFEAGLDVKFLGNKISATATYYYTNTYNQLFLYDAPPSSGYKQKYINAGKVNNWGIEASAGYKNTWRDFSWATTLNFSMNRNKIKELVPEGTRDPDTGSLVDIKEVNKDYGGYRVKLVEGGSIGDFYVKGLLTDDKGHIYVDPNSNTVLLDPDPEAYIFAGNTEARFRWGWNNQFSYKGVSLGVLIDARIGGRGVSATQALMDRFGVSQDSADARENGGVWISDDQQVPDAKTFYANSGDGMAMLSHYVYSMTNVRLRELTLGYDLPSKWFRNKVNMSVSFVGRNLFMFYNKAPFDPEVTASTSTYYQGVDFFMQPSVRTLGFSVKLQF